jgi:hypothetical protein
MNITKEKWSRSYAEDMGSSGSSQHPQKSFSGCPNTKASKHRVSHDTARRPQANLYHLHFGLTTVAAWLQKITLCLYRDKERQRKTKTNATGTLSTSHTLHQQLLSYGGCKAMLTCRWVPTFRRNVWKGGSIYKLFSSTLPNLLRPSADFLYLKSK